MTGRLPVLMTWRTCAWMDDAVYLWKEFWYDTDILRDILRRLIAHRLAGCAMCEQNMKERMK